MPSATTRVPVHLVAGWLGTGKTTLLSGLLQQLGGERVAVIVNDFGVAGYDAAALADLARIEAMAGVCLCCTAPRGFQAAVSRLLESGIDRLFVEPTGLARPVDLVDTLRRPPLADRTTLAPVIIVVDPGRLDEGKAGASVADILVANRVDLATSQELEAFRTFASQLWPPPLRVIETVHGVVPVDVLTWPEGAVHADRSANETPHAEGFVARSWTFAPEVVFGRGRLLAAVDVANAVRVKGLIRTDQGWEQLERVGPTLRTAPTAWRRDSRLDMIFQGAPPAGLDNVMAEAIRSEPAETGALEVARADGSVRSWDLAGLVALPDGLADVSRVIVGRTGRAASLAALLTASGIGENDEIVVVAGDGLTTAPSAVAVMGAGWLLLDVPATQGGPLRLIIPGSTDACANVKGVVRIAARPR